MITSDILAKIAPATPKALRDRFLPYLNEAMPRYDIASKPRVQAFLTTTCFESNYFRATKEGKAKANTKAGRAQAKYWGTGYFGRALIQVTHKEGYALVGEYLANKGIVDDADIFVNNPELLEEPKWAVEASCVYWVTHNLNKYADNNNIAAIEGIVNRGSATLEAWGEGDREAIYAKLDDILPDDFTLSAASTADSPAAPAVTSPTSAEQQPPTNSPAEIPATNNETQTSFEKIVSTGDTIGDGIQSVQTVTSKFSSVTSFGTKLMTSSKVGTGITLIGIATWLGDHWYLIAGVVLLVVAAILWNRSRERHTT